MRFKRHEDDRGGQFELISMTDIVFLLLIFFMISTTFVDLSSHLDIQLPEAPGGETAQEAQPYLIEMGIQDALLLDGTPHPVARDTGETGGKPCAGPAGVGDYPGRQTAAVRRGDGGLGDWCGKRKSATSRWPCGEQQFPPVLYP